MTEPTAIKSRGSNDVFIILAGISGALGPLLAAPILSFGDVAWIASSSVLLVTLTASVIIDIRRDKATRVTQFFYWAVIPALIWSALAWTTATAGYAAQKSRCEILLNDMLKVRPLRPDSKELYEALSCHPSGLSKIQMPSDKG